MDNIEICNNIKKNICNLSANEIEEIFKILCKNNSVYTKNNNGIFINLNWLDESTLNNINIYINFCIKSHNEINKYEDMCNVLNDNINNKDKLVDDDIIISSIIQNNEIPKSFVSLKQRTSSSMKFYLLKKKFLKQNLIIKNNNMNYDNLLSYDEYIIN